MVKVELSYNPYLLETEIKFNGSPPMINSEVEKYKDKMLQNWMQKLPRIFYDEMNGYDFDLEFSGPLLEFEQLEGTFLENGITKDKVRLILKNELESVLKKNLRLTDLLDWIRINRNRKFNYRSFEENNIDLIENSYLLFIVNNTESYSKVMEQYKVNVELINSIEELPNEFYNFPVLFDLNEENYKESFYILRMLLNQNDVSDEQLFFYIHGQVDKQIFIRTIKDLGVSRPKVVDDISDVKILHYLEVYPITTHIQNSILILRDELNILKEGLFSEIEKSRKDNELVYKEIEKLENLLIRLNTAFGKVIDLKDLVIDSNNYSPAEKFISKLENWRKRKFKMNSDNEAVEVINSLNEEIAKFYNEYIFDSVMFFENQIDEVSSSLDYIYVAADYNDHFTPQIKPKLDLNKYTLPDMTAELKACRKVNLVEKPLEIRDFLNTFSKKSTSNPIEMVEQVSYLYNDFREVVKRKFQILSNQIIDLIMQELSEYKFNIIEAYVRHLTQIINEKNQQKEDITLRLSQDEQELQNDKNWLEDFEDQLNLIERG